MKCCAVVALLALLFLAGCATPKPRENGETPGPSGSLEGSPLEERKPAPPVPNQKAAGGQKRQPSTKPAPAIVTPDPSLSGKVSRYNEAGRFVVLEFPIAHLPGVGQKLFVYRKGLKIGEIIVTGPQRDDHTVADVVTGEARVGDEVRDR